MRRDPPPLVSILALFENGFWRQKLWKKFHAQLGVIMMQPEGIFIFPLKLFQFSILKF